MNGIRFSLILLALPFAACSSSTATTTATAPDAGDTDAGTDAPSGGTQCSSARDQLLKPVDKTSSHDVSILSDTAGTKTIYVDASASGETNPRVYINLETGTRVPVTDKSATASTDWDLALKRALIFTNSGDAGPGSGGAARIAKAFASVTAAEAAAAKPAAESFFGEDCVAKLDRTNAALTTFVDWYDYDEAKMITTPNPALTFVVLGGTGKRYKVGIKSYNSNPDGTPSSGTVRGFYLLEVTEVSAQ